MIHVRDLVKRHGRLTVLDGVSIDVRRGEVAAIIGPSGGGKSTLLRCINGLEVFQGGVVEVDGVTLPSEETARPSPAVLRQVRRRVGMVFQQFNLFPHLSVLRNVMEAPMCVLGLGREAAADRARRLLARVGLADKVDAMPRHLSGGQQQRVAIARALAMEPRAILFDEPTSALDPLMTAEVLAVISDLARAGQTMVVVTHAMDFARKIAHTVSIVGDGRVIESGPPEQIFDAPREPATRAFLAQTGRSV